MSQLDNIVHRCQMGELAAFSELFALQEARVYRLAMTILQNEQDAEDAVQDAYLRIFERIKHFKGDAAFQTWMTTIVVNLCRDKMRRNKVRRAISLDWIRHRPGEDDVIAEVSRRRHRQRLWSAVSQLDEKHRLPVILHYHERLSCDEVAHVLGIRTSTVYSRLNTARQRLRRMMQTQNPVDSKLVQEF